MGFKAGRTKQVREREAKGTALKDIQYALEDAYKEPRAGEGLPLFRSAAKAVSPQTPEEGQWKRLVSGTLAPLVVKRGGK